MACRCRQKASPRSVTGKIDVDEITVLSCRAPLRLTKVWLRSGEIEPYGSAKHFRVDEHKIDSIFNLSAFLRGLETKPTECVIRGRLSAEVLQRTGVTRRKTNFTDQALPWMMIDIDGYQADTPDIEPGIDRFITENLPPEFHGISYHWHLSGSAGHPDKPGIRAHVWFWLSTPYTSAQLRSWAKNHAPSIDASVFDSIQIHYTSNPLFETGVLDPFDGNRSGFSVGMCGDEVELQLDEIDLNASEREWVGVRDRRASDTLDPVVQWLLDNWDVKGIDAQGRVHVRCPWEHKHGSGAGGVTSSTYIPAGVGLPDAGYACLHDACKGIRDVFGFLRAVGYDDPADDFNVSQPAVKRSLPPIPRDKSGKIETSPTTLITILSRDDATGFRVAYDNFQASTSVAWDGADTWRPIKDVDYFNLRTRLETLRFKKPPDKEVRLAVAAVADKNRRDTATEWANTLKWDGVERIETCMSEYFGCEDRPYARAVGLYLWTALGGRCLQEGVKADMVVVLVGKQGIGKTRAVKAISPEQDMYTEIDLSVRDADLSRTLRGKLVAEIGELRGLRSREGEAIKAWLSKTHEEWVPKYVEQPVSFARRLVFIGTTNDPSFLADETGERRWLPITVGRNLDVAAIERDRYQLWAEGIERFKRDGVMWEDAQNLAKDEHMDYKLDDPWAEAIERWVTTGDLGEQLDLGEERNGFGTVDVLVGALGLYAHMQTPSNSSRVAKILRSLGYHQTNSRISGLSQRKRTWRF